MARIVIDARLWGIKHTGIGRYTENVVKNILSRDPRNKYWLLARKGDVGEIGSSYPRAGVALADVPLYSFKEQLALPWLLEKLKPDLVHIPHFNIPILWRGKMVATIHDLITHEFRGKEQTTLPWLVYWFKYLVHLLVFRAAVVRSKALLVPTNWAKARLQETYKIDPQKIFVTPEAVDPVYFIKLNSNSEASMLKKYHLSEPFLIYTGNAYEHKNLHRLILAVKKARISLAIVCARSVFRDRLEGEIAKQEVEGLVRFLGPVPDEDLRDLYRESLAFITSSLSEGFGLSGLEAMAAGTLVLSSNATCLPEVYGNVPFYFNPLDIEEIAETIDLARRISASKRQEIIEKGVRHAGKFSWEKTAQLTLRAYEYALAH